MFQGRKLLIASKHEKERAIAPLFEQELQVKCYTEPAYDTDLLGTFTGEVERLADPVQTLRQKALDASKQFSCELVVASEGSFGPHPLIPFSHADEEWVLFFDQKNGIEIMAREVSTATNFNAMEIQTEGELLEFAQRAGFPMHGLILKTSRENWVELKKGIKEKDELISQFRQYQSKYGKAFVETDMRAFQNPSRMAVIQKATQQLIQKIKTLCPACKWPGFEVVEAKKGLPCGLCGWPTTTVKSHLYACRKCHFAEEKPFPFGKQTEDPQYCPVCNP